MNRIFFLATCLLIIGSQALVGQSQNPHNLLKILVEPHSKEHIWEQSENHKMSIEDFFQNNFSQKKGFSTANQFRPTGFTKDVRGGNHYFFQQTLDEIPVEGTKLLVHERNQFVQSWNGHFIKNLTISTIPTLSEQTTLKKVLKYVDAKRYAWQDCDFEAAIQTQQRDSKASFYPKGELVIFSPQYSINAADYKLCYKFDVYAAEPIERNYIYIDAHTGEIVGKIERFHTADVDGFGLKNYGCTNPAPIITDLGGGIYRLKENVRQIFNFDCLNTWTYANVQFIDIDNFWTEEKTAVGIHWASERIWDYFLEKHNWQSFDGAGAGIINFIHYGNNFNNAYFDGNFFVFGDGNNVKFEALSSLDIVAHEFTHAVIESTANLIYKNEPGALSESFSDIFAVLIEYYAEPNCANWIIGEEVVILSGKNGIRNLATPNDNTMLNVQPHTYQGENWVTGYSDGGGVHTNCGPHSYAFYLLAEGGVGINGNGDLYDVDGIGLDKTANIFFHNLKNYLFPTASYADARNGAILSAIDLYGEGSEELQQTINAFCAIGLGTGGCSLLNNTLSLYQPNDETTVHSQTVLTFQWLTGGTIDSVRLEYSINGGTDWSLIANSVYNTNNHDWIVPNVSTSLAQIRITAVNDETIVDVSENFTIESCNLLAGFQENLTTIEAGETVYFTNTSSNAETFQWLINGLPVSDTEQFQYTFSNSGTYMVQLNAESDDCADDFYVMIDVYPNSTNTVSSSIEDIWGGNLDDRGFKVIKTSDGNIVVAGYRDYQGSGYGSFAGKAFLRKYNINGDILWYKEYVENNEWITFYDIIEANDEGLLAIGKCSQCGANRNKLLILKTDKDGNELWRKTNGGSDWTIGYGLDKTSDGGYIITGNTTDLDPWLDVFLLKIDANGNQEFKKYFARANEDTGDDVIQTSDGGYLIVGVSGNWTLSPVMYLIKTDAEGNKEWDKVIGNTSYGSGYCGSCLRPNRGSEVKELPNDEFIIAGIRSEEAVDTGNVALIKIDNTGDVLFEKIYSYQGKDYGYDVQILDNGYLMAAITDHGNKKLQAWIIETDTLGNIIREKKYGGVEDERSRSIVSLPSNRFAFTDHTTSIENGSKEVYFVIDELQDKACWSNPTTYNTSTTDPSSLFYHDYNGDTYMDFIVNHNLQEKVTAYLNNGDGTFADGLSIDVPARVREIIFADFNNDTYIDLAMAHPTNSLNSGIGLVSIHLGNENNTFEPYTTYNIPYLWTYYLAADKLNGDDYLDLVVTAGGGNHFTVLTNDGDGTFTVGNSYATGLEPLEIEIADFDGDNNMDVVMGCSRDYGELNVFFGNGDGTFGTKQIYMEDMSTTSIWVGPRLRKVLELNGNDGVDILVNFTDKWDDLQRNYIYTLLNDGDGNFTENLVATDYFARKTIDWDNDGDSDIIANRNNFDEVTGSTFLDIALLENDGEGNFTDIGRITEEAQNSNGRTFFSNLNNDDFEDFVSIYQDDEQLKVFLQQTCTENEVDCTTSAAFTYDKTALCNSSEVTFTNLSENPNNYQWFIEDVEVSTDTHLTFTFVDEGDYEVKLIANGESCSHTYIQNISIYSSDCVWAGDFNFDGIVNHYDLLPLGLNFGKIGTPRSNASLNWVGQPSAEWSLIQEDTGVNGKHIDGNGDGLLDLRDVDAIETNYGKTHDNSPNSPSNSGPITVTPQLKNIPTVFDENTIVKVALNLNNTIDENVTAYSIAMDVNILIPPNFGTLKSLQLDASNSWLGQEGVDLVSMGRLKGNNKFELAMTRLDQQNRVGSDDLIIFTAVVAVESSVDTLDVTFDFDGVQLMTSNATIIPVGGPTKTLSIYQDPSTCQGEVSAEYVNTSNIPTVTHVADFVRIGNLDGSGSTKVLSNQFIQVKAGGSILLEPGTDIRAGAIADFYIQGCTTVGKQSPPPVTPKQCHTELTVYPNPVRGSAKFKYGLCTEAVTEITIMDKTGRQIKRIKSRSEHEIGTYLVDFKTCDLEPGIYFCVLETNGEVTSVPFIKIE